MGASDPLDPEQEAVLGALPRGPIRVIAGAGTGKTRTLQEAFARLLRRPNGDFPIDRLLAVTFTNRAAEFLKRRILGMTAGHDIHPAIPEEPWIGTFHAFAHRLLSENGPRLGLAQEVQLLDDLEAKRLFQTVLDRFIEGEIEVAERPPIENVKRFGEAARELISRLKDDLVSPEQFLATAGEKSSSDIESSPEERDLDRRFARLIHAVYAEYDRELARLGFLDYGSLLVETFHRLRGHPSVLARTAEKFRFIFVDEFQDTNRAQLEILRLLSPGFERILAVGDKRQAIYEWRGARRDNIDEIGEGAASHSLIRNYRSVSEILEVADDLVSREPDVASLPRLVAALRGSAREPRVFLFEDRELEPEFVANEAARLATSGGYAYRDMVLLLRSVRSASRPFEDALRSREIPYRTVGGSGFYDRQEIGDVLAYLRVVHDPYDEPALFRVLQNAPAALDDDVLYRLKSRARRLSLSLFDALEGVPEMAGIHAMLRGLIDDASRFTPSELVFHALDRTGYRKYVQSGLPDATRRLGNLRKLYEIARRFEDRNPFHSLGDFLASVDFALQAEHPEAEAALSQDENALSILTVHQAKGLEFPVVFVGRLQRPSFPTHVRYPEFVFTPELGFARHDTKRYDRLFANSLKEQHYAEERRLLYVAMTRAQERLYLTRSRANTGGYDFFGEALKLAGERPSIARVLAYEDSVGSARELDAVESPQAPSPADLVREVEEALRRLDASNVQRGRASAATPDVSLSFTSLAAFLRCPLEYAQGWLLGLPSAPSGDDEEAGEEPGRSAAAVGTLVHETIRVWNEDKRRGDLLAHLRERARATAAEIAVVGEAEAILARYSEEPGPPGVAYEKEFTLRLAHAGSEVRIHGFIDELHLEGNRCRVVDFKTNRHFEPERYSLQMEIYAAACLDLYAPLGVSAIDTELRFLRSGQRAARTLRATDVAPAMEIVRRAALDVGAGRLEAPEARDCARCRFGGPRGACPQNLALAKAPPMPPFPATALDYHEFFYDLLCREADAEARAHARLRAATVEERVALGRAVAPLRPIGEGPELLPSGGLRFRFAVENRSRVREGDLVRLHAGDFAGDRYAVGLIERIDLREVSILSRDRSVSGPIDVLDEEPSTAVVEEMKSALLDVLENPGSDRTLALLGRRKPEFDRLVERPFLADPHQDRAISLAIAARDFALVHGPAGTGKTTVIAALARELTRLGARVLLSAYTNRAVDHALLKVRDAGVSKILRIGRAAGVDPRLADALLDESLSPAGREKRLLEAEVIAVTAASANRPLVRQAGPFDVSIVDEAGQMPEPLALAPIARARRFVLVGDHLQLAAVLESEEAASGGLARSLFERLMALTPEASTMLKNQYRMNARIAEFPSREFYGGQLVAANAAVAGLSLEPSADGWKRSPLAPALDPSQPFVFVDCGAARQARSGGAKDFQVSPVEVERCLELVAGLLAMGLAPQSIGVIAPYRAQVSALRGVLPEDVEVDTVDRFQGTDREAVILSCVVREGAFPELLRSPNRLNVALTRAKRKLVVLGDGSVRGDGRWERLVEHARTRGLYVA